MKHKDHKAAEKLAGKQQTWLRRSTVILGLTEAETRQLLSLERRQSIRRNPLRPLAAGETARPAWLGQAYTWMPDGYELAVPVAEVRDAAAIASGEYFIQNAASWLPVLALDPRPDEHILDVCAAPGGKTSHIAAITGNRAHLTANDNSRSRLAKLRANMERLGADAEYTLYDAAQLARKLADRQFDRILIDAPCSGEGLMNITRDKDVATWSVAHIKRLQQLQKRILTQAWQLLRPGGTLMYSTCTMAPEENEAVIDYLLRNQSDAGIVPLDVRLPNAVPAVSEWNGKVFSPALSDCLRLKPSPTIEAFFVCKLRKSKES